MALADSWRVTVVAMSGSREIREEVNEDVACTRIVVAAEAGGNGQPRGVFWR